MVEGNFLAAENSEICGSKSYFTTMGNKQEEKCNEPIGKTPGNPFYIDAQLTNATR